MRLNYYYFPESASDAVKVFYGADFGGGSCRCGLRCNDDCLNNRDCAYFDRDVTGTDEMMVCANIDFRGVDSVISGISVSRVKSLISMLGGTGCTEHIDRSGGVFEVTPILVGKNNSKHRYSHHL